MLETEVQYYHDANKTNYKTANHPLWANLRINDAEYTKYNQYNFKGEATGMMSAQSIAHLMIVIFIVFGNITYFLNRKRGTK